MPRVAACFQIVLLTAMSVVSGSANAVESERDFAKCQDMLGQQAAWLLEKADKADSKHSEKVDSLIRRQAASSPGDALEESRLRRITDRVARQYEITHYRRVLIDAVTDEVLNVENTAGFRCFDKLYLKRGFKSNFEKYEQVLEEVEEAIEDRLDIEQLDSDEGLVVILLYVKGRAEQVDINRLGAIGGNIRFGPVNDSDYFRVIKAKAGKYRWHSIWYESWMGKMFAYLRHSKSDFTVEAGKINYTGAFIYRSELSNRYTTKVVDRTSVVISILESRYPELLDKFEVTNGLTSDNRFIDFYFSEKRAALSDDNET